MTAIVLTASSAFAQGDLNKTIIITGVQSTNYYFSVGNGLTLNSTLLSAKAQNKPISRMVYSQNGSSGVCTLELIEYR